MASYEYFDIEEYRDYIVGRASTVILYKSNTTSSDSLTAVLNDLFDDAYKIIVNWRKLDSDDEFLSQKWDTEITAFVVDSYVTLRDSTLAATNINGVSKTYKISPTAKLKSSIPQVI